MQYIVLNKKISDKIRDFFPAPSWAMEVSSVFSRKTVDVYFDPNKHALGEIE